MLKILNNVVNSDMTILILVLSIPSITIIRAIIQSI
jgi:hypothetical protein